MVLAVIQAASAQLEKNDTLFTYTIDGFDKSPYLTRTLFPRVGDHRPILHHIHRPDQDPYPHNHPWKTAQFIVLSGGYTEQRLTDFDLGAGNPGHMVERVLRPGDTNRLDADTYHHVSAVEPNTWTFGIVGERVQEWGFLTDEGFVEAYEYFRRKNHTVTFGGKS